MSFFYNSLKDVKCFIHVVALLTTAMDYWCYWVAVLLLYQYQFRACESIHE